MATNEFIAILTTVVNKCRDILRREGITGMDSMKHLSLYTLVRFIDEAECLKLNVPSKFAWERFIEFTDSRDNHQASYNLLYCKNGATEDLISYFDSLFGTKNFNYKLQSPSSHVEIINEFKKLDLKHLEGQIDVLGSIYEIHLGTGSNKSAMRDLGQFFTERSVCKYMVGLCNPKILPDGRAESILDPTMGTGGFLTSYIQHLGSSPNWSEMQGDIAGCDIDEFVMAVGRINLYLQTGIVFNRIIHRDSLKNDVGEDNQRRKFKNILANMPFGVKGLKYKDCCASVKALGIDGTKSEPLFLQLMMASLDDGGRCAVVVPDGAIVNQSKCHNLTRNYLLDHFELKRVIKTKGQFFSNTGIQPSILFFENTGKPTSVTEFWEVEKNSAGVITETLVVSVPREKIDTDSYSLDMRRYVEVAISENPSAFPMVKLGDILLKQPGKVITLEKAEDGVIPLYSASVKIRSHTEPAFDSTPSIIQACVGSNLEECIHYVSEHFAATGNLWVLRSNAGISLKYVYYYLKLTKCILSKVNNSVLPKVNYSEFVDISIPLPPLETQQQIVSELDNIYENAHKARQMATSIKSQMASIMKSVGMRGYERKKISEACDISKGKRCLDGKDTGYPYQDVAHVSRLVEKYILDGPAVLTPRAMSIGRFVYTTEKCHPSDDMFILKSKVGLNPQFLYYYSILLLVSEIKKAIHGVKPTIDYSAFDMLYIYIPPLEIQQKILTILNEMESECKSLEQMASNAEERAKFILAGFMN